MALGRTYDEVMQVAGDDYKPGVGTRSEYRIIEKLGLKQMIDFRTMNRGILSPKFFLQLSWGRRAILAVPSLNIEGSFHSVYWTGAELLDPCQLKTYSAWEDLRPDEIIQFSETGPHPEKRR
jgi:hypothetical protein